MDTNEPVPGTSRHRTLRELISHHAEHNRDPVFEPTDDPILVLFAKLFVDSELVSFDANKHLRTGALSPLYDCETVSVHPDNGEPELFVAIWTPVWAGTDPVTGFRTGHDSSYLGATPTIAMPQDERTAALLLLVTSSYVHLSARRERSMLLVQGAIDDGDERFRFAELVPSALPAMR